jgi:MFS family permease
VAKTAPTTAGKSVSMHFFSPQLSKHWRLVAACSALMAMSSGAWYTGSLFFVAIIREFGWGYASTASIFSLFTVLYGAWGILIGHLVDRVGPRAVVVGGGLLLPLALLGSGSAHALWHLYVTHSLLTALGLAATTYVPVSLVLARRFQEERGLAFGIASAGVGIGILVFVPFAQVIMSLWGWRVAYRALAVAAALVVFPVGFFALKGEQGGIGPDDEHARIATPTPASGSPGEARCPSGNSWPVLATATRDLCPSLRPWPCLCVLAPVCVARVATGRPVCVRGRTGRRRQAIFA